MTRRRDQQPIDWIGHPLAAHAPVIERRVDGQRRQPDSDGLQSGFHHCSVERDRRRRPAIDSQAISNALNGDTRKASSLPARSMRRRVRGPTSPDSRSSVRSRRGYREDTASGLVDIPFGVNRVERPLILENRTPQSSRNGGPLRRHVRPSLATGLPCFVTTSSTPVSRTQSISSRHVALNSAAGGEDRVAFRVLPLGPAMTIIS